MRQINIMTSCDDKLAVYILPQLISINLNMPQYDIHFYLFHYRISKEKIKLIMEYAKILGNITFHEIIMNNVPELEELAKLGGRFPAEAYAYLHCHDQLPKDMDRILYIDAGDVIIHGDISEYYFDDFEDKSFIVTPNSLAKISTDGSLQLFSKDDLDNPEHVDTLRQNHVGSGFIVLNLEKLRAIGGGLMKHYFELAEKVRNMGLAPIQGASDAFILGDQGMMGLAFVGDMKIFGYENIIKHVMHTWPSFNTNNRVQNMYIPYHFFQGASYFDDACECLPVVLHYGTPQPKPWTKKYTPDEVDNPEKENNPKEMGHRHFQQHKIWWQYYALTLLPGPPKENFSLNLDAHDKNFAQINPLHFMASWHLTYKRYDAALAHIEKGLALATIESNSFHYLWQLKLRAFMENEKDPLRHEKSLEVINEYISLTTRISGMLVYMHGYKGYCFQQMGMYNDAIAAYMESDAIMESYTMGADTGDIIIFPIDPTVIITQDWLETCAKAELYYPKTISGVANDRKIRSRTPIPHNENKRRIAECYTALKDYDEAFRWANRTTLENADDIKNYFRLINESGQSDRVSELFGNIERMLRDPNKHKKMNTCLDAFDAIVLLHPLAKSIIAPFADRYDALKAAYPESVLGERYKERFANMTPVPRELFANLSWKCNLKCKYCFAFGEHSIKVERTNMTWDVVYALAAQLKEIKTMNALNLAGFGEPLMHPEWFEICDYLLRETTMNYFCLTTNAMALTEANVKKLSKLSCETLELRISIDGESPEDLEFWRVGTRYETLKKNVIYAYENLDKNKTTFSILNSIVLPSEFLAGDKTMDDAVAYINASGEWLSKEFPMLAGKINSRPVYGMFGKPIEGTDFTVFNDLRLFQICAASFGVVTVVPSGDILASPCSVDVEVMGNVLRDNIQDIWLNGEAINRKREAFKAGKSICKGCIPSQGARHYLVTKLPTMERRERS